MENKFYKEIKDILQEFLEIYKNEKQELSRNQGALWNTTNSAVKDLTILKEEMSMLKRTLYGEDKTGFKGVVQNYREMCNSIQTLSDTVNKRITGLDISLNSFMNEFKEKEIQKNTTMKNINIFYTLITSAGFLTFCGFLYKLLTK